MKITVGCDPEVFVTREGSTEFVSAHGLIPGNKQTPFPVPKGAVQVDGMALEFNIDPAETVGEFITNVRSVYEELKNMVPGYNLVVEPTAVFPKAHFDQQPDEAKALGCDPDFSGWTTRINPRPNNRTTTRTGAGHIHIGWGTFDQWSTEHHLLCSRIARQCDYFLGIQSLKWDPDNKRRAMYGGPGAFRPKDYGIEYRTLSNAWLRDPRLIGWVFQAAKAAVVEYFNGNVLEKEFGDTARLIINENQLDWETRYPGLIVKGLPRLPALRSAA